MGEFFQFSKKYIDNNSTILEIGCNDGFLLNKYKAVSSLLVGIDTSEKMCQLTRKLNLNAINKVFGKSAVCDLLQSFGKQDLIIANNVLNHSNDPLDFLSAIEKILTSEGVFIMEVPYWKNMMESNRFPI